VFEFYLQTTRTFGL